MIWNGTDSIYTTDSRGIDGPIGSLRLIALMRGFEDYQYLKLAERLGVTNVDAIVDSLIGRAVDNWGDDSPPWPEEYSYGYAFQPHWKEKGYYYDNWRRVLADSILARSQ